MPGNPPAVTTKLKCLAELRSAITTRALPTLAEFLPNWCYIFPSFVAHNDRRVRELAALVLDELVRAGLKRTFADYLDRLLPSWVLLVSDPAREAAAAAVAGLDRLFPAHERVLAALDTCAPAVVAYLAGVLCSTSPSAFGLPSGDASSTQDAAERTERMQAAALDAFAWLMDAAAPTPQSQVAAEGAVAPQPGPRARGAALLAALAATLDDRAVWKAAFGNDSSSVRRAAYHLARDIAQRAPDLLADAVFVADPRDPCKSLRVLVPKSHIATPVLSTGLCDPVGSVETAAWEAALALCAACPAIWGVQPGDAAVECSSGEGGVAAEATAPAVVATLGAVVDPVRVVAPAIAACLKHAAHGSAESVLPFLLALLATLPVRILTAPVGGVGAPKSRKGAAGAFSAAAPHLEAGVASASWLCFAIVQWLWVGLRPADESVASSARAALLSSAADVVTFLASVLTRGDAAIASGAEVQLAGEVAAMLALAHGLVPDPAFAAAAESPDLDPRVAVFSAAAATMAPLARSDGHGSVAMARLPGIAASCVAQCLVKLESLARARRELAATSAAASSTDGDAARALESVCARAWVAASDIAAVVTASDVTVHVESARVGTLPFCFVRITGSAWAAATRSALACILDAETHGAHTVSPSAGMFAYASTVLERSVAAADSCLIVGDAAATADALRTAQLVMARVPRILERLPSPLDACILKLETMAHDLFLRADDKGVGGELLSSALGALDAAYRSAGVERSVLRACVGSETYERVIRWGSGSDSSSRMAPRPFVEPALATVLASVIEHAARLALVFSHVCPSPLLTRTHAAPLEDTLFWAGAATLLVCAAGAGLPECPWANASSEESGVDAEEDAAGAASTALLGAVIQRGMLRVEALDALLAAASLHVAGLDSCTTPWFRCALEAARDDPRAPCGSQCLVHGSLLALGKGLAHKAFREVNGGLGVALSLGLTKLGAINRSAEAELHSIAVRMCPRGQRELLDEIEANVGQAIARLDDRVRRLSNNGASAADAAVAAELPEFCDAAVHLDDSIISLASVAGSWLAVLVCTGDIAGPAQLDPLVKSGVANLRMWRDAVDPEQIGISTHRAPTRSELSLLTLLLLRAGISLALSPAQLYPRLSELFSLDKECDRPIFALSTAPYVSACVAALWPSLAARAGWIIVLERLAISSQSARIDVQSSTPSDDVELNTCLLLGTHRWLGLRTLAILGGGDASHGRSCVSSPPDDARSIVAIATAQFALCSEHIQHGIRAADASAAPPSAWVAANIVLCAYMEPPRSSVTAAHALASASAILLGMVKSAIGTATTWGEPPGPRLLDDIAVSVRRLRRGERDLLRATSDAVASDSPVAGDDDEIGATRAALSLAVKISMEGEGVSVGEGGSAESALGLGSAAVDAAVDDPCSDALLAVFGELVSASLSAPGSGTSRVSATLAAALIVAVGSDCVAAVRTVTGASTIVQSWLARMLGACETTLQTDTCMIEEVTDGVALGLLIVTPLLDAVDFVLGDGLTARLRDVLCWATKVAFVPVDCASEVSRGARVVYESSRILRAACALALRPSAVSLCHSSVHAHGQRDHILSPTFRRAVGFVAELSLASFCGEACGNGTNALSCPVDVLAGLQLAPLAFLLVDSVAALEQDTLDAAASHRSTQERLISSEHAMPADASLAPGIAVPEQPPLTCFPPLAAPALWLCLGAAGAAALQRTSNCHEGGIWTPTTVVAATALLRTAVAALERMRSLDSGRSRVGGGTGSPALSAVSVSSDIETGAAELVVAATVGCLLPWISPAALLEDEDLVLIAESTDTGGGGAFGAAAHTFASLPQLCQISPSPAIRALTLSLCVTCPPPPLVQPVHADAPWRVFGEACAVHAQALRVLLAPASSIEGSPAATTVDVVHAPTITGGALPPRSDAPLPSPSPRASFLAEPTVLDVETGRAPRPLSSVVEPSPLAAVQAVAGGLLSRARSLVEGWWSSATPLRVDAHADALDLSIDEEDTDLHRKAHGNADSSLVEERSVSSQWYRPVGTSLGGSALLQAALGLVGSIEGHAVWSSNHAPAPLATEAASVAATSTSGDAYSDEQGVPRNAADGRDAYAPAMCALLESSTLRLAIELYVEALCDSTRGETTRAFPPTTALTALAEGAVGIYTSAIRSAALASDHETRDSMGGYLFASARGADLSRVLAACLHLILHSRPTELQSGRARMRGRQQSRDASKGGYAGETACAAWLADALETDTSAPLHVEHEGRLGRMLCLAHGLWSATADALPQRLSAAWSQRLPRALQAGAEAYVAADISTTMFALQIRDLRETGETAPAGVEPRSVDGTHLLRPTPDATPGAAAFVACSDAQLGGSSLARFLRGQVSLERCSAEHARASSAPSPAPPPLSADEEPAVFMVSSSMSTRQVVATYAK